MSAIPAADLGVTDPLDPLLGARLGRLLDAVDERAGIRVDDTGITVRGLLRTRHTSWARIERIELDNRLDVAVAALTRFLPVRRVPVVGGLLTDGVRSLSAEATRRLVPKRRARAGWVVATIHQQGMLRRDVEIDGGAWLTAVLHPRLTEAIESHAAMRHIPLDRA